MFEMGENYAEGGNEDPNAKARKQFESAVKRYQEDQQRREIARRFLDNSAYERLMNIKASNPELYEQVVNLIISLIQSQRLSGKITEKQLVSLLEKVTFRPEPKISFKHK